MFNYTQTLYGTSIIPTRWISLFMAAPSNGIESAEKYFMTRLIRSPHYDEVKTYAFANLGEFLSMISMDLKQIFDHCAVAFHICRTPAEILLSDVVRDLAVPIGDIRSKFFNALFPPATAYIKTVQQLIGVTRNGYRDEDQEADPDHQTTKVRFSRLVQVAHGGSRIW
jgi:hypothetical protein